MKKRITGVLLSLCLCLTLLPSAVFAADPAPAADTADFTAADGGAAALALLNAAKWENAEPSTWDSGTKTLTLKGLRFVTTAATAVKLPAGATIVLADGTHNTVIGGDAAVTQDGTYHNDIYIYGIFADGDLTIQGGTDRSAGSLTVRSGAHSNTGDAWTYSAALSVQGTLRVEGGETELTGGEARSADCAFSIGLLLPEGSGLSMTGGSLTAIGGRSRIVNSEEDRDAFSYGIEAIGADISVSGGKLWGKSENQHGDLSYGIDLSGGDLLVSGSASVNAVSSHALYITNGCLKQSGGSILASHAAGIGYALSVEQHFGSNGTCGSIEVTGGRLDASGGDIYMSQYQPTAQQGNLTVSGGIVFAKSIFGAERVTVTDAAIGCAEIAADELTLNSGRVMVLKLVQENNGTLYAEPALWLKKLTVNGGELNVSWVWDGITPIVFPADENAGFPTPLVRMYGDDFVAAFNGGTTILNTGCAGNIALKLGQLTLGTGVKESGADTSSVGEHRQEYSDTPVVFSNVVRIPVTVPVGSMTVTGKPYDGTTAAGLAVGSLDGVQGSDTVTLGFAKVTANFHDANVGENKAVKVEGTFDLRGKDAYRYVLNTQPTDLSGLTADITCATAQDTTILAQTIRVGRGGDFRYPSFKGVGSETATGSVHYTYRLNDDTSRTYEIAADDIPAMLSGLSVGDTAHIGYTVTGSGNYSSDPLTGTVTVTVQRSPSTSSSGSSTIKTETTTNPDGSTTKTETKSDGTVVETTTSKDGSTTKTTTKKDGSSVTESKDASGTTGTVKTDKDGKTEAEAKISNKAVEDAKKSGEAVKVPTEVKAGEDSNSAPTVKVELPKNAGETKIEIPVSDVNSGTVAVIVHPDGTEEIVKDSKPTEDGVQLTVDGSATVKIIDNSKDFHDTRDHWSRDEVNFVVARELFNGVGNNLFGVGQPMTRGMVNTVLARLAGIDTTPSTGQNWYEVGTAWAKANGITDGTNPEASVTREQLATLLYRFSGTPEVNGDLLFSDAHEVSGYAENALIWAMQNGILNGVGNDRVAPGADAQRAQVAAMMARYLKNVA